MGWHRAVAVTLAAVALATVAVGWVDDAPELTAADAVSATETAFRGAGLDADVQPDPVRSTYASPEREPVEVWAVRATVRSEPVEVQLARAGAQPVYIDDRSLDGSSYVLSEIEYEAVARHVGDPVRARAIRHHIALTIAAALVVALAIAHAAVAPTKEPVP